MTAVTLDLNQIIVPPGQSILLQDISWQKFESILAGLGENRASKLFYVQNVTAIRGRLDIDLNSNPPPDLVLEIDITSKSLDRLPIYARLGVGVTIKDSYASIT